MKRLASFLTDDPRGSKLPDVLAQLETLLCEENERLLADIEAGNIDVVVADGFTGNVALKAIEGTAKLYTQFVRDAFRTSTFAKIGYLFASGAWVKLRKRVDPRRYNGGVFLGLDGVCVKSHGGTDALGFAYAIGVAVDLVRYEYKNKLVEGLGKLHQVISTAEAPTTPALQASGGGE